MLEALRGKKTYILMGLVVLATLYLVWQGTMTVDQAVPALAVALAAVGFRDAVAQAMAKLLAELARQSGEAQSLLRQKRSAVSGQPERGPDEGSVRRL